jgi:uncharacterized protein (DUF488 family)
MLSTVWTVGHSSRPLADFLDLLARYRIEAIADVRRFPGSKRQPAYGQPALRASLARESIDYVWLPALGGRRRPRADSPNTAWRNESFRGYADHMASAEFASGMDELLVLAAEVRTAMMCAEAVWWRCHRGLIADTLSMAGVEVLHIVDERSCSAHPLTSAARIVRGRLTYASRERPDGSRASNARITTTQRTNR